MLHQEITSSFDMAQHLQAFNSPCVTEPLLDSQIFIFCFKALPQNPWVAESQEPGGSLVSGVAEGNSSTALQWAVPIALQTSQGSCSYPELHNLFGPCNKGTKIMTCCTQVNQSALCCSTHLANTLTNTSAS